MEWRLLRQRVRQVTGYALPVIDALHYRDVIDILTYENEWQKAHAKR